MAIWQYNVFLVPLINFDKKYLEFIKQEDSNYLKSTECFWEETFINKNEIELKIDKFITDYKSTSDNFLYWKGDTSNFYDNDSSIAFDENDNINFFNFRFDLRNEINVIQSVDLLIDIAKEYHLKFKEILPPKKLLKLYNVEREFQRMLLKRLGERKMGRP